MNLNTGYFVGQVIKWFIIIVFLLPSLKLVGLDLVATFLQESVLGFLPRVVVAAEVGGGAIHAVDADLVEAAVRVGRGGRRLFGATGQNGHHAERQKRQADQE